MHKKSIKVGKAAVVAVFAAAVVETLVALTTLTQINIAIAVGLWVSAIVLWRHNR